MTVSKSVGISVAVIEADSTTLIALTGTVDFTTLQPLLEVLVTICGEPPLSVVMDLSALKFVGLCGIAAIIDAAVALDGSGTTTRLVGASPLVHRVVETLGVADLLALDPTE